MEKKIEFLKKLSELFKEYGVYHHIEKDISKEIRYWENKLKKTNR